MIELEVYAAGVRNPDKMMALALELDGIAGLRYKVDTNHDIVYMEFSAQPPSAAGLQAVFLKTGLEAKFVGQLPPEVDSKKKTQRIDVDPSTLARLPNWPGKHLPRFFVGGFVSN
jgi:hypothetical protein